MTETRIAPAKVSDPIIFRPMSGEAERVVRPCSRRHRRLWLAGYIVLSCSKCFNSIEPLDEARGSR